MAARSWRFWVFIGLLVFLHFALHLGLGLASRAPDLLTVAVLLGARRLVGSGAALLGLGIGLLQDSLSLVAFGADAVTLALLGFLGARSRDYFVGDSLVFVAVYLFLGKWLHDALLVLLRGGMLGGVGRGLLLAAPLAALYAAGAGIAALLIYRSVAGER